MAEKVTNVGYRPLQLIDGTSQLVSVPIDAVLLGGDEQGDDPEIYFTHDPKVEGCRDVEVMLVNSTTSADVSGMYHLGRFRTYEGQGRWDLFVRNAPEQAEQASDNKDEESAPRPAEACPRCENPLEDHPTGMCDGPSPPAVDEEPEQTVES